MGDVKNVHDNFFKEVFSNPESARIFFQRALPAGVLERLDLGTLRIRKDSFITKELQSFYSDMLYSVKTRDREAFIYLLLEHKSFQDTMVGLQLMEYMVRIYRRMAGKKKTLPLVIPIVIYHGRQKWKIERDMSALFGNPEPEMLAYVPKFRMEVFDLGQKDDSEFMSMAMMGTAMLAMKYVWDGGIIDAIPKIQQIINEFGKIDTGIGLWMSLFRYITQAARVEDEEAFERAIADIDLGGDTMGTLAEKWFREGEEKGLEKGRQEGLEVLLDLVELKFGMDDTELVEKVKGLDSLDAIDAARRAIRSANTIEELKKLL
jgi:predicted transposase YdaD